MIQSTFDDLPPIFEKIKEHGFAIFDDGDYDLNIIGIRNLNSSRSNLFDDKMIVAYRLGEKWITEEFIITTDPSSYYLMKEDYKPCAIYYHPQQARGAYKIGLHRGKYKALTQHRAVKFWRDGNKDDHLDYKGEVYKQRIGLNIHKASQKPEGSHFVDVWSAGCQVFKYADKRGFERFMWLCEQQVQSLGYTTFTYTLISEGGK